MTDPDKTEGGRYVSGSNCIPENALAQMLETKRHFGKLDKRQGYHFIISFEEEDITEETAFAVVGQFVKEYLGPDFEAVYAVHNDTDHIHGHIIFNSVRCTNGYKYDCPKGEWEHRIQPLVNRLCEEHGLSVLDMEEVREKRKKRREGIKEEPKKQKALSGRNQRIKRDVDRAVQDADTYEEFLENLEYMGYELSGKKHLALREIGAERARRIDLFGEEYTEEMLRCRIEKPPVPAQQEDRKEAELLYIYIPYRNRHLTRHQKECFIRKYRVGKIHKSPKPWEYKSSLQALARLQEEYLFWAEHGICSKEDLSDAKTAALERLRAVREKKRMLEEEKKPYQAVIHLLGELEPLQMEAELYREGYPEFAGEALAYEEVCKKMEGLGYLVPDARKIEAHFQTRTLALEEEKRQAAREKRIAERLLRKVYSREKSKGMPDEIQKKDMGGPQEGAAVRQQPDFGESGERRQNDNRRATVSGRM
ncbi:MAG: relaxase/mobilization nuclease domain-containing protein [Oliverpabstia sp.]|nr:relaxase/mobilization nuclease domain-containing protein [Oliverpabstia sp.]